MQRRRRTEMKKKKKQNWQQQKVANHEVGNLEPTKTINNKCS
jgi:hypothetical protein